MVRAESVAMLSKDQILSYFSSVGSAFESGWFPINCPCHDDKHASASGVYDDDGFSFNCHCCGAKTEQVVAELGLQMSDVRPYRGKTYGGKKSPGFTPKSRPQKMSVEEVTAIATAAMGDDDPIEHLAKILHVRPEALKALGVGYVDDGRYSSGDVEEPYWTFPERDENGNIIGVNKRYKRGGKKQVTGSARGLIYATDVLEDDPDLILCPEGGSDVAACLSMGIAAIGRPSNDSGAGLLVNLLAPHVYQKSQKEPKIVIVGEWDEQKPSDKHPNGIWPGRDGAIKTAQAVANRLGITVYWCMTPKSSLPKQPKDLRSIISDRYGYRMDEYYSDLGPRVARAIMDEMVAVEPVVRVGKNWDKRENGAENALPNHIQDTHLNTNGGEVGSERLLTEDDENHHYQYCEHCYAAAVSLPMSQFFPTLTTAQIEQEWKGSRLDLAPLVPPPTEDAAFKRNGYCPNGIGILLRGINRMLGKAACMKTGCGIIAECSACACRSRVEKYENAASCFYRAMDAGSPIYHRYVNRNKTLAVHKALNRGNMSYKEIKLDNGSSLIMAAAVTENGVVQAHKVPRGFVRVDQPYRMLQSALARMDTSVSTPVSSSRDWEYKPPKKESQWELQKAGVRNPHKTMWSMQDDLVGVEFGKLHGSKMEQSLTGQFPPDWSPADIETAFQWWAMGQPMPENRRRPRMYDMGEFFT